MGSITPYTAAPPMRSVSSALALVVLTAVSASTQAPADSAGAALAERAEAAVARADTAAAFAHFSAAAELGHPVGQRALAAMLLAGHGAAPDTARATALLHAAAAQRGPLAASAEASSDAMDAAVNAAVDLARLYAETLFRVSAEVAPGVGVTAVTVPGGLFVPGPFGCGDRPQNETESGVWPWAYTRLNVARGGRTVALDVACLGDLFSVTEVPRPYGLYNFSVEGHLASNDFADGASTYFAAWDLRTGRRIYAGPGPGRGYGNNASTGPRLLRYLAALTADVPPSTAPERLGLDRPLCDGLPDLASVSFEPDGDEVTATMRAAVAANVAALAPLPYQGCDACALVAVQSEPGEEAWLAGERAESLVGAYTEAGLPAVVYEPGRDVDIYANVYVYAGAAPPGGDRTTRAFPVTCVRD